MKKKNEWVTVKIVITGTKLYIVRKPKGVRLEITDLDQEWNKQKTKVYVASKIIEDGEIIKEENNQCQT